MSFDKHQRASAQMYKQKSGGNFHGRSGSMEAKQNFEASVAKMPAPNVVSERASYVIINKTNLSYKFLYQSTGSIGTTAADGSAGVHDFWHSASIATGNAGTGPVRLDINPIGWATHGDGQGDGAAGNVTFVIKKSV
tara:strand:- start:585 stop:995 length:411 start_codon:yes stop_codon:yes gene_type:complete